MNLNCDTCQMHSASGFLSDFAFRSGEQTLDVGFMAPHDEYRYAAQDGYIAHSAGQ